MRKLAAILIALCPLVANAGWTTNWVRPCVGTNWMSGTPAHKIGQAGIYGTQDGSSFANAFNGLESVNWSQSNVYYLCDTFVATYSNANFLPYQFIFPISNSWVIVRGDWPGHPGVLTGAAFDRLDSNPVYGPDANGVYWNSNNWTDLHSFQYEIDGATVYRLQTLTNLTTWAGTNGAWCLKNGTNYFKTTYGGAPTNNIAVNGYGYTLGLPQWASNIWFVNLSFLGGGPYIDSPGDSIAGGPSYPASVPIDFCANHITFDGCTLKNCDWHQLQYGKIINWQTGHDHWNFLNCDISGGETGLYGTASHQSGTNEWIATMFCTVSNCSIYDIDGLNYHYPGLPAVDGHAIGMQNNSGCTFIGNTISNCGTAIALFCYTTTGYMTNNVIQGNIVHDVHVNTLTGGEGIWLSGQTLGVSVGNTVLDNIVYNCGLNSIATSQGACISSSLPDYVLFAHNVTRYGQYGILNVVNSNPVVMDGYDNILMDATNSFVKIVGSGTSTNEALDYGAYWSNNVVPSNPFNFSPAVAHDAHSAFGDPKFAVNPPVLASDFKLATNSPIQYTGKVLASVPVDFGGVLFGVNANTSIGAWQYVAPVIFHTNILKGHWKGGKWNLLQ